MMPGLDVGPIADNAVHRNLNRTYGKGQTNSAPVYEPCRPDLAWKVVVTEHGGHDQSIDDLSAIAGILIDSVV
jgi:hypothetical protein